MKNRERQYVTLPIGAVDGAASEDVGAVPEVGLELGEGEVLGEVDGRHPAFAEVAFDLVAVREGGRESGGDV